MTETAEKFLTNRAEWVAAGRPAHGAHWESVQAAAAEREAREAARRRGEVEWVTPLVTFG